MIRALGLAVIAGALLAAGCQQRPHAPAILDESIYQNDQEGFRLQAPADWAVNSRAILPAGQPVTQERKLIGYKRHHDLKPASFEISCLDERADADLIAYFTGNQNGMHAWRPTRPAESVDVGGLKGRRFTFVLGQGREAQLKEITAVHRGGRFYFFTLMAAPDDASARDESRRAVASVTWKTD